MRFLYYSTIKIKLDSKHRCLMTKMYSEACKLDLDLDLENIS